MKTINASGKTYNLFAVTGKVAATNKNMETTVSGTGGGGGTFQGTGYSAPVTISSKTTVHDNIFLIDDAGKEHSFQLQDFDVACREGHDLKVIWSIKDGNKTGEYIAVQNKTTGQNFFNIGALRRMFRPSWLYPIILTVLLVAMSTGLTIFLAFVTWIAFVAYTIMKANTFKKEFNPDLVS